MIAPDPESDSDRTGTGERGSATGGDAAAGADILPDRLTSDPTLAANPDRCHTSRSGRTDDAPDADDIAASDTNGMQDDEADDYSDDDALESLGKAIIAPVAGAVDPVDPEPSRSKPPPATCR